VERQTRGWLAHLRLESLRSQIIALAVLAALVPALIISLVSYAQSRRALTEKIEQELVTTASQAARESDVWLKERLYELRVFANSSIVLEAVAGGGQPVRLVEYLNSVQARFPDYEELQLVDTGGKRVGSSASDPSPVRLPEGWGKSFESTRRLVAEPYWDEKAAKVLVVLGVPVQRGNARTPGALVARVNFASLAQVFRAFDARSMGHVYLASERGMPIVDSRGEPAGPATKTVPPEITSRLLAAEGGIIEHRDIRGTEVVGSAQRLSQAPWFAAANTSASDAYRQAIRFRNLAFAVIGVVLVVIGIVAYWLASLIARPLGRLTGAATKVAAGDLSVGLPAGGGGEVGYLTQVFNAMIESLRKNREELERLSTTDILTGLGNRRHLMNLLPQEIERARRAGQPFSILMLDVDHFKEYNDEHGHQAGDEVLARVGTVLQGGIRPYDCAARYGGEEFLVVLSGVSLDDARDCAERIRKKVQGERFDGRTVTVSIGVAEYPTHGESENAIIAQADAALFRAKRAGRDRVVCASTRARRQGA
jgi:diguanylate cyclase (GGDEF)-like protein